MAARKILTAALFATALCASEARAINPGAGTGGAAFLRIGLGGARGLAMGRAVVAASEGADALTWNPAGLALAQQREFEYSYYRYVQDITSPLYMAYAHPFGRTVIGANVTYFSVDGFDVRDITGRPLNSTEVRVQNGFGTLAIARSFWYEKFFLGGGLKVVHEDNDGTVRDNIVGDFGALLKPNSYVTFGFASQNFGAGNARVASITRGGASFRMFGLMTAAVEINKASDGPVRLGLGGEFTLPEDFLQLGQVYLRAGFRSTDDLGQVLENDRSFLFPMVGSPRFSFGVGVFTAQAFGYGVAFDYSLISLGALGTADMLTLKVKF